MDIIKEWLSSLTPYIGYCLSVITFILGRWLGRRDVLRNERNKAAEPVNMAVKAHLKQLQDFNNTRITVTQEQINRLIWHSKKHHAEQLYKAWQYYKMVESEAGDEYQSNTKFSDFKRFISAANEIKILSEKH